MTKSKTTIHNLDKMHLLKLLKLLNNYNAVSFQSVNFPDHYIRHSNYKLRIDPYKNE